MNKKHILIIDDEDITCKAVSRVLKIEDYEVTCADDGEKGLAIILKNKDGENKIDLVITDIQMPVMNGLELIKKLKDYKIDVPVIVITAHYGKKALDVLGYGKIDFLEKPFGSMELLERVDRICLNV